MRRVTFFFAVLVAVFLDNVVYANTKTFLIILRLPSSAQNCPGGTGQEGRLHFVQDTAGGNCWVAANYQVPASTNCPREDLHYVKCDSDRETLR